MEILTLLRAEGLLTDRRAAQKGIGPTPVALEQKVELLITALARLERTVEEIRLDHQEAMRTANEALRIVRRRP